MAWRVPSALPGDQAPRLGTLGISGDARVPLYLNEKAGNRVCPGPVASIADSNEVEFSFMRPPTHHFPGLQAGSIADGAESRKS